MKQCLFCDVVNGTEPSAALYRDDICTVILDVYPASVGHALMLPNRHVALATDMSAAEFQHLARVWRGVLAAYRASGVAQDGANLLLNDGPASNQHIPHVHLHLLPRQAGDSARTLFTFATRTVNIFTGRKSVETLREFARRLAPQIAEHIDRR
jgi:histidine triad (HIT) family protein